MQANHHYQRASLLFEQGKYKLAEKELKQELTANPQSAEAHALLAACLELQEIFDKSAQEAKLAIACDPNYAYGYYISAAIELRKQKLKEAKELVEKAIQLDHSVASYFSFAADIALYEEEWTKALSIANQGLAVEPTHSASGNCRAIALAHMGQLDDAEEAINQSLRNNPERSDSHANKGWILIQKGQASEAVEHLREALRLNPNSNDAKRLALQALKGRHPIYGKFLQIFLKILNRTKQIDKRVRGFFIVLTIIILVVAAPLRYLAGIGLLCCCFAGQVFTFLLRFDPLGKQMLTPEQKQQNNKDLVLLVFILGIAAFFTGLKIDYYLHGAPVTLRQAKALNASGKHAEADALYHQVLSSIQKKSKGESEEIFEDTWNMLNSDPGSKLETKLVCLKSYAEFESKNNRILASKKLLNLYKKLAAKKSAE